MTDHENSWLLSGQEALDRLKRFTLDATADNLNSNIECGTVSNALPKSSAAAFACMLARTGSDVRNYCGKLHVTGSLSPEVMLHFRS